MKMAKLKTPSAVERRKSKRVTAKGKRKSTTNTNLDDDVIRTVLMRLPAKSLDGLRYVCKQWFNMISDSYFIQQHSRFFSEYGLIIQEAEDPTQPTTYFIKIMKDGTVFKQNLCSRLKGHILASCNGLLLLQARLDSDLLHVINPATNQQLDLPTCYCGPGYESECHGFAFVPSTHEYRVVYILVGESHFACQLLVLGTSDVLHWRSITTPSLTVAMRKCFRYRPISVNGVLYWVEYLQNMVLSLDVGAEKFYQIPFPKEVGLSKGGFIGMGNFLCFLKYRSPSNLDMWLLKDLKKGEWIKQSSLMVQSRIIECMPLCSFENGQVIVFRKRKTLWSYNVELEEWTKCANAKPLSFWGPHVNSIISPKTPTKRLE